MTGIVVAVIAAISAAISAFIAYRAQRVDTQVHDRAVELEGYNELVTHLRGHNADLIRQNITLDSQVSRLRSRLRTLRDDYSLLWHAWPADTPRPEGCPPPDRHRWTQEDEEL